MLGETFQQHIVRRIVIRKFRGVNWSRVHGKLLGQIQPDITANRTRHTVSYRLQQHLPITFVCNHSGFDGIIAKENVPSIRCQFIRRQYFIVIQFDLLSFVFVMTRLQAFILLFHAKQKNRLSNGCLPQHAQLFLRMFLVHFACLQMATFPQRRHEYVGFVRDLRRSDHSLQHLLAPWARLIFAFLRTVANLHETMNSQQRNNYNVISLPVTPFYTYISIMGDFSVCSAFGLDVAEISSDTVRDRGLASISSPSPFRKLCSLPFDDALSSCTEIRVNILFYSGSAIVQPNSLTFNFGTSTLMVTCSFCAMATSSLLFLRFNKWSNELVNDRLAFMKIVLPPKYWFKNSVRFSAVSWTCRCCRDCKTTKKIYIIMWKCIMLIEMAELTSLCARNSIIKNWFCSANEWSAISSAP